MSGLDITVTDSWRAAFPDGAVAVLALDGVTNPAAASALDTIKADLEAELRERYGSLTRPELRALPVLGAYATYYRRFDKTYHVQLQLESVALKGKPIASVSALVETMFMAELKNHLLTAVHDLDAVEPALRIEHAEEPTPYTLITGQEGALRPGDMYMADAKGVICSIIYGQDARTRATDSTTSALYVTYVPPGVDPAVVDTHLDDITRYAGLVSPGLSVLDRRVFR
ncbi:MAG TPA: hypothetical protein VMM78_02810 [Thermomicrobiales bacterium]|nr:hypothetical protein [Thermomicrobiales bacterium]